MQNKLLLSIECAGFNLRKIASQGTSPSTAFVIEEDMLSSQTSQKLPKPQNQPLSGDPTSYQIKTMEPQNQPLSGDPTSYQIKTMEVFERVEHDEHDDVTYAPEIQSLEIPPDQMSENSDNFQEYFDRTAAEGQLESRVPNMSSTTAQRAGFMQEFHLRKQTSLLSVIGVTSMQEILLSIDSLDALSVAMRKAGLERTNLIFGTM
ncbi:hypothetical protein DICVIV_01813 [Dictyocaulus viviparus]|uniref:Uncharacterized protein n=1 Tax=Dictyocaulus viviparus TaxID=29172 RepID=A0A0D8Y726_DICVI|nr:hypothetical protein DICVIV_01813 [Dictyocaulus viviparus]